MRLCPQCANSCDETHRFCPSCGFPIGKLVATQDDPLIGRTLPGGYVILELVGIGGMGRVYRAEQTNLGRTVAVKIIHPHLVGEENAAARFITEARAASRLNHPNSVGIIDFGKTVDGQLYLVMEFLRGRDLARVMSEDGVLPLSRVVDVLRQTLAALAEAHNENIIHRDLKPENVILEPVRTGADFVKVVDFGLAKMRVEAQQPSITSPGIVCGTPEYMSPEQARGDPLDARSDLYTVGVILYQILTGRLPFEADSPTQVVLAHLTEAPRDPREVAPDRQIPAPFADLVLKALAKEPENRFQDADAFSAELARTLGEVEGDRTSLAQVVAVRCTACGALNPASQKFCGECGAATTVVPLARASTPPTQPPPAGPGPAPALRGGERPNALAGAGGARPPSLLPFVGRRDDLAWLESRRAEARTLVGARVVGEVGVGKTRLVREFLDFAASSGDVVVQTGPDPAWAEVGYWGLRRAIVQLAALPAAGGKPRDWVAATPEARHGLADVFGDAASDQGSSLSPEERRFAAAEALRWAIVRASERARGHRVVLAVDDLNAVDGATRNALSDALSDPPLVPALLVATYSPGFDPGWAADVAAARILVGLPTADILKALAQSAQPASPVFGSSRTIVPLYVEQLLRFLREESGGVPPALADVIAVRVERLPAEARRVLQAAAVWGDDADDQILLRMLGDGLDLVEALGLLRRHGMVHLIDGEIRTSHPLVREVTLATIPAAVKRELHAAAAQVCDARNLPIEVRALHELHGGTAFQALLLLERVSVSASARGDHQGTIMALRRALELARRELFRGELDDPMRAVLIFSRKLGEALAKGGQLNDAEGVLREALDVAGKSGSDRAAVLAALAHVAHGRDRRQEARDYLREAVELASQSGAREILTSLETLRRSMTAS
ncbi:MAG TPA: protein kinase [Polyangiaceae bacterium]|jgi:serine/threonine-protein kinase|nr:protein kinase [Polyangiaceae bacterium]